MVLLLVFSVELPLLRIVQILLRVSAIGLGTLWYQRSHLPNTEEGRWLDERTMLVFDGSSVVVYGLLFICCLVALVLSMLAEFVKRR